MGTDLLLPRCWERSCRKAPEPAAALPYVQAVIDGPRSLFSDGTREINSRGRIPSPSPGCCLCLGVPKQDKPWQCRAAACALVSACLADRSAGFSCFPEAKCSIRMFPSPSGLTLPICGRSVLRQQQREDDCYISSRVGL